MKNLTMKENADYNNYRGKYHKWFSNIKHDRQLRGIDFR